MQNKQQLQTATARAVRLANRAVLKEAAAKASSAKAAKALAKASKQAQTTHSLDTNQKVVRELVTPAKATKWLNANKTNRKLRDGLVEKYAFDMAHGLWTECPEPITFYEDGDVADGQHRLWAIIESVTSIWFTVHRGLPRPAGLNINTGLNRNLVDNAHISGTDRGLSHSLVATARAVTQGQKQSKATVGRGLSFSEKIAMVDAHREACSWAIANGPKGRMFAQSIIQAAIARAWYHEDDKARLAHFGKVVTSGFMTEDGDGAAIAVRNYLITNGSGLDRTESWRDTFLKAQNAIRYFMRRKKLTIIKSVKDEVYPLKD